MIGLKNEPFILYFFPESFCLNAATGAGYANLMIRKDGTISLKSHAKK
jgi:hypothetical protein